MNDPLVPIITLSCVEQSIKSITHALKNVKTYDKTDASTDLLLLNQRINQEVKRLSELKNKDNSNFGKPTDIKVIDNHVNKPPPVELGRGLPLPEDFHTKLNSFNKD